VWQPDVNPTLSRVGVRILLVEDDVIIAELLTRVMQAEGYETRVAGSGAAARSSVDEWRPDLIILDLILPDEDGLFVCNSLKAQARVPILVCSGTRRSRDEFLSFKLGADDFISKPFDIYYLTARVEALLRRRAAVPEADPIAPPAEVLQVNDLVLDEAAQSATVAGQPILLTPLELRFLLVLARRPGVVVPRERLAQLVWGQPTTGGSRTVDVHAGRLRAKLAHAGPATPTIVSVRGFGYKLVPATPPGLPISSDSPSDAVIVQD
jgi:DNA-binding response OmpR family regulator